MRYAKCECGSRAFKIQRNKDGRIAYICANCGLFYPENTEPSVASIWKMMEEKEKG